jgi:hypothetical protein
MLAAVSLQLEFTLHTRVLTVACTQGPAPIPASVVDEHYCNPNKVWLGLLFALYTYQACFGRN